jgi:hypothetical protein
VKRALTIVIVSCLTLAASAVASSVEVKELKQQTSSRHVRVAVSLNGHPAAGASVDFCTAGDKPCVSVLAGKNGISISPRLPDGNYTVTASIEDVSGGDLYLHVSHKGKVSAFSIDLTESFRAQRNYRAAADKLLIRATLQVFQRLLQDPSGATIPEADVNIVRRGSKNHAIVQRVKTDHSGHFSASLGVGMYVAFFSCQGFRTEIVPVEIAPQGSKELLVKLQLGQATQSIRVAAN